MSFKRYFYFLCVVLFCQISPNITLVLAGTCSCVDQNPTELLRPTCFTCSYDCEKGIFYGTLFLIAYINPNPYTGTNTDLTVSIPIEQLYPNDINHTLYSVNPERIKFTPLGQKTRRIEFSFQTTKLCENQIEIYFIIPIVASVPTYVPLKTNISLNAICPYFVPISTDAPIESIEQNQSSESIDSGSDHLISSSSSSIEENNSPDSQNPLHHYSSSESSMSDANTPPANTSSSYIIGRPFRIEWNISFLLQIMRPLFLLIFQFAIFSFYVAYKNNQLHKLTSQTLVDVTIKIPPRLTDYKKE